MHLARSLILGCSLTFALDELPSKRMDDGKQWMTKNLALQTDSSYCYEGSGANCQRYGRLYTWEAARHACLSLGNGWRLPTNEDWQRMAKPHGGVRDDSADEGEGAYQALLPGGASGFNAVFGGGREPDGRYARLDAHGFYWTASEANAQEAWFYNLGRGGKILNRHTGEKTQALAVRCIR